MNKPPNYLITEKLITSEFQNDFLIPSSNQVLDFDRLQQRMDSFNLSQITDHSFSVQETNHLTNLKGINNSRKHTPSRSKEKEKLETSIKWKTPNKFKLDLTSVKKKP